MDDLQLIDLDQPRPGYRKFIACWLRSRDGLTYVVDPGPANTIPHLVGELRRRGVARLDRILLTHIHLDHGGGAGQLAAAYPEARVVAWEPAHRHLVDPERLWEGSLKVLGDTARLFGEPTPVPRDRLDPPDALAPLGIGWLPTPGHAVHHVGYVDGDLLYAGEAAGMTCPVPGGARYQRPATPPRFHPDAALASLDALLALDPMPRRLAWAHHGLGGAPAPLLRDARGQIGLWLAVAADLRAEFGGAWNPELQREAIRRLAAADPLFAPFAALPDDLRAREDEFLRNTLEGMLGHLAEVAEAASPTDP